MAESRPVSGRAAAHPLVQRGSQWFSTALADPLVLIRVRVFTSCSISFLLLDAQFLNHHQAHGGMAYFR